MTPPDDTASPLPAGSILAPTVTSDPLWYKDAIIYQLHVKAFFDADNDGIGDFEGLRHKLDYLQDLGVTTLWLLPFYPSTSRITRTSIRLMVGWPISRPLSARRTGAISG